MRELRDILGLHYLTEIDSKGIFPVFGAVETLSLNNPDVTWAVSGLIKWGILEAQVGFIVVCLPTLWSPVVDATKSVASHVSLWLNDHCSWRARSGGQSTWGSDKSDQTMSSESKSVRVNELGSGNQGNKVLKGPAAPNLRQDIHQVGNSTLLYEGFLGVTCRKDLDVFQSDRRNEPDVEAVSPGESIGHAHSQS